MALHFYQSADPDTAFSVEGAFTNPLVLTFDGVNGGVIERRIYLRNDDSEVTYSNITVEPDNNSDPVIEVDGSGGYSWKLYPGDQRPLNEQWELVTAGDPISLDDIEDTVTYLPFWIRVEVPAGAPVLSSQNVALIISATEAAV